jgi:hypothetical protein
MGKTDSQKVEAILLLIEDYKKAGMGGISISLLEFILKDDE